MDETEKTAAKAQYVPTKRQNVIQGIKFLLFSISAGVIQFVSAALLNDVVKLPYWLSYLIALILSVIYNFTVNRKFTFKSAANVPVAMLKVLGYYAVFTPLSTLWSNALTTMGWAIPVTVMGIEVNLVEYIVLVGTMIINMVTEFLFCRFVVYRKDMYTNAEGQKEMERLATESMPKDTAEEITREI